MTLRFLVKLMERDFCIWWKHCRPSDEYRTDYPIIYYFLGGEQQWADGFSKTILPIYYTLLKHKFSTEVARKLITMTFHLISFFDRKNDMLHIHEGDKLEIVKKLSGFLARNEQLMNSDELYCEISLVQPSILSAMVSANFVKASSISISLLLERMQIGDDCDIKQLENGLHRSMAATHCYGFLKTGKCITNEMSASKPVESHYPRLSDADKGKPKNYLDLEDVQIRR